MDNLPEAQEMRRVFDEAYALWEKKHASYGSHNISTFGLKGVFIRLWDKLQRLYRLVWLSVKADVLSDETLEDTFLDIINYGAISIVIMRGKWPPNLFADEEKKT
jgi:hypothetical protein